jgi:hypothetical protein
MVPLGSINNVQSSVTATALAQSNSSGSQAAATAFSTVMNDVNHNNSQSAATAAAAAPKGDRSTWAEVAAIDPTSGKAYFTPVDAQVEAALQGAVAAHIPGFDVDEVSDQTYIKPEDIRLQPAPAFVSNTTSGNAGPSLEATNPAVVSANVSATTSLSNLSSPALSVASPVHTAAAVKQAQTSATLLNTILNNDTSNTTAQSSTSSDSPSDVNSLTANLGKIIGDSIAKNTYNTIDKLLAS